MSRWFHPLTCIGGLLLLVSPFFMFVGHEALGIGLMAMAYALAGLEFKKYTSDLQFMMLLLSATAIGIALDLLHNAWPVLTVTMFIAAFATIARQKYMQHFTYVNLLWLDSGMAMITVASYLLLMFQVPFSWELCLAPLIPIGGALGLTLSYVQDGLAIRRSVSGGYQVTEGQVAPELELLDEDGATVRLSDYKGKHPVLLIFVRGDWCPGCHMMLRTYESKRAEFQQRGVHVLGIGPDDISINKSMVERIGVGFRMLSDNDQEISRRYGVVYNNPVLELAVDYTKGIPLPASFLVDMDGVVRYVSRPERVGEFLNPELIFNVLERFPQSGPAWTS